MPIFLRGFLTPLEKKGDGIRPIAVVYTLRRLAVKMACSMVKPDMSVLLAPCQLGFGMKQGIETAIHAARCCICHLLPGYAIVRLDFKNALDSVRRDRM